MSAEPLAIKLETYEGPLELLLHLIKKNEVDLANLPLALITAQYLEHLEVMESFNLEIASEFLLMAATLIQLKSAIILPRTEENQAELEDLKQAILGPLLEYAQVKGLALVLNGRLTLGRDVFTRGYREIMEPEIRPGVTEGEQFHEASLMALVAAFQKLMDRTRPPAPMAFQVETKTIRERLMEVKNLLTLYKRVNFFRLCQSDRTKADLVLSFLAILELARVGFLKCEQTISQPDLFISLANPLAEPDPDFI